MEEKDLIPEEIIENKILLIRGKKVMLDRDLAKIYGVETRRLNEQVKRNINRFPLDFMFQLTAEEFANLKSHFATSSSLWGGRRKLPLAFTEHGAIMLAAVLNTPRAVEMSVFVVRVFVRLRELVAERKELGAKLKELENRIENHDEKITTIFTVIRQLMAPPETGKRKIGFGLKEKSARYGKKRGMSK